MVELWQCTNIPYLREKCNFDVSSFCQVVQKHKLFEVAQLSVFRLRTLSVAFVPKISRSVHVYQNYSKPKVGRFLRHGVV